MPDIFVIALQGLRQREVSGIIIDRVFVFKFLLIKD